MTPLPGHAHRPARGCEPPRTRGRVAPRRRKGRSSLPAWPKPPPRTPVADCAGLRRILRPEPGVLSAKVRALRRAGRRGHRRGRPRRTRRQYPRQGDRQRARGPPGRTTARRCEKSPGPHRHRPSCLLPPRRPPGARQCRGRGRVRHGGTTARPEPGRRPRTADPFPRRERGLRPGRRREPGVPEGVSERAGCGSDRGLRPA